jgi:hypothetical protein
MSKQNRRPNKPRKQSANDRDLQQLADNYRAANQGERMNLQDLAEWIIETGQWTWRRDSALKELVLSAQYQRTDAQTSSGAAIGKDGRR